MKPGALATFAPAMMRERISIALKGAAMGMAEVVPGVSGGTIAFVTGIYERLLEAITAFDPRLLSVWREGGLRAVWLEIQGPFLVNLLVGMLGGLIVGVFAITYFLAEYPPVVWAFFFGLILASSWYIGRMISPWSWQEIVAVLAGLVIALAIVTGAPAQGNTALWFVFVSGVIAISALLLPGVSGSFILLLLGMYGYVIPTVKAALSGAGAEAWSVLLVFGLGCLTGLATFSRVLSWLFERFPQVTLALLTGFMMGSLYKLWPWRVVTDYLTDGTGARVLDEAGEPRVIAEALVWPADYAAKAGEPAYLAAAVAALVAGAALVYGLSLAERSPVGDGD